MDVRHHIDNLENNIIEIENNIMDFLRPNHEQELKKSLYELKSDLKHLSIIANGAPLSKTENRKIMDFLRNHYNTLQKLSVPV
ncbi:MAG: hypothetical protein ACE5RC_05410 [Nitrosopumilus sp.]